MKKTIYTSDFFNDLPIKPRIELVQEPWLEGTGYCFFNFNTPELADCYSIDEIKAIRDLLDKVISSYETLKHEPSQMSLWPEVSEENL